VYARSFDPKRASENFNIPFILSDFVTRNLSTGFIVRRPNAD
jgi:hypothetical protein